MRRARRRSTSQRTRGTAIVGLLLDRGAPVDAANEDGNTPLHAAVAATQLGAAKQLLSAGATADAPGKGGVLPMRIAARHGMGA